MNNKLKSHRPSYEKSPTQILSWLSWSLKEWRAREFTRKRNGWGVSTSRADHEITWPQGHGQVVTTRSRSGRDHKVTVRSWPQGHGQVVTTRSRSGRDHKVMVRSWPRSWSGRDHKVTVRSWPQGHQQVVTTRSRSGRDLKVMVRSWSQGHSQIVTTRSWSGRDRKVMIGSWPEPCDHVSWPELMRCTLASGIFAQRALYYHVVLYSRETSHEVVRA